MQFQVGVNAGSIWYELEKGESTPVKLKKATQLDDKNFWMSLGWLLREDKIIMTKSGKSFKIRLK